MEVDHQVDLVPILGEENKLRFYTINPPLEGVFLWQIFFQSRIH